MTNTLYFCPPTVIMYRKNHLDAHTEKAAENRTLQPLFQNCSVDSPHVAFRRRVQ